MGFKQSRPDIDAVFLSFDEDGSGEIDYLELRAALRSLQRVLGPTHPESPETVVLLAQCLALRGGPQAAELLREVMPALRTSDHRMLPIAAPHEADES